MICLWVLICSAILLAGFIFWGYIGRNMWAFRHCIAILTICFLVFSFISVGARIAVQDSINSLRDDYQTLTLYYETVNHTSNEYIRFDYYKNVSAFNKRYSDCIAYCDSVWVGVFCPDDGLKDISPIEFNLVGDECLLENVK